MLILPKSENEREKNMINSALSRAIRWIEEEF